jgi:hypothetical protein
MASLSVSSPSSRMGCGRSVGYCRGDDERLDLLEPLFEPGSHDVSRESRGMFECAACLPGAKEGPGEK